LVETVTNPGQTNPTATFTYQIFDPSGNSIEQALEGITFTAAAGGFSIIKVEADSTVINKDSAAYTFTLKP
jgi:hypothetical protein